MDVQRELVMGGASQSGTNILIVLKSSQLLGNRDSVRDRGLNGTGKLGAGA
jgi:hypothetical protein